METENAAADGKVPHDLGRKQTLYGLAEIADYFGVSRQLAYKWAATKDFPDPIAELSMGKVWNARDVWNWAKRHDRRKGAGPLPMRALV